MSSPCSATTALCLRSAGYAFVGRYYTSIANDPKLLTAAEAQVICASGLAIVSIYEDGGTSFSAAIGTANANAALKNAGAAGQPQGTAIYFAVDYDASADDLSGRIIPYFAAVKAAFQGLYEVGVYGSGLVCSSLLGAGLASYAWLSQSTGFRGSSTFTGWAILQLPATTVCSQPVDLDVAQPPFGAFSVVQ